MVPLYNFIVVHAQQPVTHKRKRPNSRPRLSPLCWRPSIRENYHASIDFCVAQVADLTTRSFADFFFLSFLFFSFFSFFGLRSITSSTPVLALPMTSSLSSEGPVASAIWRSRSAKGFTEGAFSSDLSCSWFCCSFSFCFPCSCPCSRSWSCSVSGVPLFTLGFLTFGEAVVFSPAPPSFDCNLRLFRASLPLRGLPITVVPATGRALNLARRASCPKNVSGLPSSVCKCCAEDKISLSTALAYSALSLSFPRSSVRGVFVNATLVSPSHSLRGLQASTDASWVLLRSRSESFSSLGRSLPSGLRSLIWLPDNRISASRGQCAVTSGNCVSLLCAALSFRRPGKC
mmetsp:Transcript_15350/g.28205  ORF Transcript_15350/g.28205 Transcript_15350/m.28205 type:complete len:345 (-) Transcript_15350:212-1246(-)